MPSRSSLLLLGSGSRIRHDLLLESIGERADITLLQREPATWQHPYVSRVVELDVTDWPHTVDTVRRLVRQHALAAVASFDESLLPLVGELSHVTGVPGLSREAARVVRDKHAQRRCLAAVPHLSPVRSALARNLETGVRLAADMGYPVVIKPRNQSGNLGVRFVERPQQFRSMFAAASGIGQRGSGEADGVLIEEFLDGPEFSIDCAVLNGEAVPLFTARILTESSFQVIDTGSVVGPGVAAPEAVTALEAAACAAAVACGVDRTIANVDVKWTRGQPRILEVNGRPGGLLPHLAWRAGGIRIGHAFADVASGRLPAAPNRPDRAVGFAFVYPHAAGQFGGVQLGPECAGQEWLVRVQETAAVGARVEPPDVNPWGHVAWALITGDTASTVEQRVALVRNTARVELQATPA